MLSRRSLGTLDAVTIGRYAMTIGALDPVITARRPRGRPGTLMLRHPNLLAAMVEWGVGTPESRLQADGTPVDGEIPLGDLGLRVMGAGEEMELVNPVVAGTEVVLETRLDSVTPKQNPFGHLYFRHNHQHLHVRRRRRFQPKPPHRGAAQPGTGGLMSNMFRVGDQLPPLKHTATPLQLFRYSAVTWNPHRIHFDEPYAREEGHAGIALHSHLRAALALRCVTEGLGTGWRITKVAYRLRKPVYAPADVAYCRG